MSQKKQIFKLNTLKNLLNDENSCVSLMQSTRLIALPPFFLNDMKSGILYLLNTMLKKYDRSLGGIIMGYQNIKVLMDENTGIIPIGTSETEVNISVEFYVFQPKIGSYLEGVINKKSNNHIGCLVHQYFNATIFKPEDVLYEDWICKNFNVDDKIIFKVKDLDFTTLLPFIEGIYDGKNSLEKVKFRSPRNCDIDDMIVCDLNNSQNKMSVSKGFFTSTTNKDRKSDDFFDIIKDKNKHKEELNATNLNNDSMENQSLIDLKSLKIKKKKKKKEKKEEMKILTDGLYKEKDSNDKDGITDSINKTLQAEESSKKNKKKKRKKKDDNDGCPTIIEKVERDENNIFEKLLQLKDENSSDFLKVNNDKMKIKRKKYQNEEPLPNSNKTKECLPSLDVEDNVLYSTQLDPTLGLKNMRISFCSPIPFEEKMDTRNSSPNLESSVHLYNQDNEDNTVTTEKKIKKKHKKRRREKQEELEDSPATKKIKISNTLKEKEETKEEMESSKRKSILQVMMEEVFRSQLNKSPKTASFTEEKFKKEAKKKKKTEKYESLGYNEEERKSEAQGTLNELYLQELQRMKEELSKSNKKESFKKNKKTKVKLYLQEALKEKSGGEPCKVENPSQAQINSTNESDSKLDVKTLMKKLYKQEINRVKENLNESDVDNIKEKKRKSVSNNREASRVKTHLSLYDKLLNEAKSAIDLENSQELIKRPTTEWLKKKKDSELSDLSTSSSGRKESKKKGKKQKTEDCQQTCNRFKNGSMYDVVPTPEKINPDKSLFSDSEQSHTSPFKRAKEVNGDETESRNCQVKNLLHEFFKEEMIRLKNESNSKRMKSSEKNEKSRKAEEKTQISGEKEESLYDKLLRQAKSLIDGREVPPTKKKEKKKEGKKIKSDA